MFSPVTSPRSGKNFLEKDKLEEEEEEQPTHDYGSVSYWDERYTLLRDEEGYDWLMKYKDVCHFLHGDTENPFDDFIKKDDQILMVGSGSAMFSQDMYDAGFKNITNIDTSKVIINQKKMEDRIAGRRSMRWHCMDASELNFPSNHFDVVFDKSLIDCLFCCENPDQIIKKMINEAGRVLRPNGIFISMSLHKPEKMLPYLEYDTTNKDSDDDQRKQWVVAYTYINNPAYLEKRREDDKGDEEKFTSNGEDDANSYDETKYYTLLVCHKFSALKPLHEIVTQYFPNRVNGLPPETKQSALPGIWRGAASKNQPRWRLSGFWECYFDIIYKDEDLLNDDRKEEDDNVMVSAKSAPVEK